MKPFFVYLLRCADGSYYAGHTDDLDARLQQNVAGRIGYTAARKPFTVSWQGEFETREAALAFELRIKGWSRAKREALARGDWVAIQQLARSRASAADRFDPTLAEHLAQSQGQGQGQDQDQDQDQGQGQGSHSVRPELVERQNGAQAGIAPRLRQAQPERIGGGEAAWQPTNPLSPTNPSSPSNPSAEAAA